MASPPFALVAGADLSDSRVVKLAGTAIALGSDCYNRGEVDECYALYHKTVLLLLAVEAEMAAAEEPKRGEAPVRAGGAGSSSARAEELLPPRDQRLVHEALCKAEGQLSASWKAWTLRLALDELIRSRTVQSLAGHPTSARGTSVQPALKRRNEKARADHLQLGASAVAVCGSLWCSSSRAEVSPRMLVEAAGVLSSGVFSWLPDDAVAHVHAHCSGRTLGHVTCVCRAWNRSALAVAESRLRAHRKLPLGSAALPSWTHSVAAHEALTARVGPKPTWPWWREWPEMRVFEMGLSGYAPPPSSSTSRKAHELVLAFRPSNTPPQATLPPPLPTFRLPFPHLPSPLIPSVAAGVLRQHQFAQLERFSAGAELGVAALLRRYAAGLDWMVQAGWSLVDAPICLLIPSYGSMAIAGAMREGDCTRSRAIAASVWAIYESLGRRARYLSRPTQPAYASLHGLFGLATTDASWNALLDDWACRGLRFVTSTVVQASALRFHAAPPAAPSLLVPLFPCSLLPLCPCPLRPFCTCPRFSPLLPGARATPKRQYTPAPFLDADLAGPTPSAIVRAGQHGRPHKLPRRERQRADPPAVLRAVRAPQRPSRPFRLNAPARRRLPLSRPDVAHRVRRYSPLLAVTRTPRITD